MRERIAESALALSHARHCVVIRKVSIRTEIGNDACEISGITIVPQGTGLQAVLDVLPLALRADLNTKTHDGVSEVTRWTISVDDASGLRQRQITKEHLVCRGSKRTDG